MSRRVKREISSLSFSLNRVYHGISTFKPSTLIISVATLAFAVFFFGGGLYDIVTKPLPSVYYNQRFLLFYPSLSEQFIADSVVAMALYVLGIVGLLAMYQSTKYAYKPRQAYMMFLVGVLLIFMAYILIEAVVRLKING